MDANGDWYVTARITIRTIDPIIFDLDGNGIHYQSQQYVHDYAGPDGRNETIRWVSPGDGILVYDWNRDGVGQTQEWALTSFVSGARTDLEALRAFDSNGDGVLSAADAAYADFRVGIDANGDGLLGAGELHSLGAVGIASINLTESAHAHGAEIATGVFLNESGAFTRTDGRTGLFHSVGFEALGSHQLIYSDGFAKIVSQGAANTFVAQSDTATSVDLRWYSYAGYSFSDFFLGGGNDYLVGTEVANVLSGGSGADQIYALGGDDFILADAADVLYGAVKGGSGTDVLYLTESVGAAVYAHAHEVEAIIGSAGDDILSGEGSAEVVLDGGNGNDILIGSSSNDVLVRSAGQSDLAQGGAGDDLYVVSAFNDNQSHGQDVFRIADSQGVDTVFFVDLSLSEIAVRRGGNDLHLYLSDGSRIVLGSAFARAGEYNVVFEDATRRSVQDLGALAVLNDIFGTDGLDDLRGSELDDRICGFDGSDALSGYAGNDLLDGGAGTDALSGGAGDDYYVVNSGDVTHELQDGGFDIVAAHDSFQLVGGSYIEMLVTSNAGGMAAMNLIGNELGQQIIGNNGDNILNGMGGADVMSGLGGNDFYVVDGDDQVFEGENAGYDIIASRVSHVLAAGSHVEMLVTADEAGTAAIDLTGNERAQTVWGNAGDNRIDGGQRVAAQDVRRRLSA